MLRLLARWAHGVRLLSPTRRAVLIYWLVAAAVPVISAAGLQSRGRTGAALWGVPLHADFGGTPEQMIRRAYVEMLQHACTLIGVPFLCLWTVKPLLRTFQPNFIQFLRFSSSTRLFVESVRLGGLLSALCITMVPLLAGALIGTRWPEISAEAAGATLASSAGALATVALVLYGFASIGMPAAIASTAGFVSPIFFTGLRGMLERGDWSAEWVLAGLPYGITWSDPSLSRTVVCLLLLAGLRLAASSWTRRLTADSIA